MQTSEDIQRELSVVSIDPRGGEPLDRSGFETEEPNPDFSSAEHGSKE
jgi:hypothetical protein